jgi:hypothetical protein
LIAAKLFRPLRNWFKPALSVSKAIIKLWLLNNSLKQPAAFSLANSVITANFHGLLLPVAG